MEPHPEELSTSARRTRWIHSTSEHDEQPGQIPATRDHDVISQLDNPERERD